MTQYEWRPTICAPRDAPCVLVDGAVTLADGSREPLAIDVPVHNGWGTSGPLLVVGAPTRAAPVSVRAAWYSAADDAFYFAALPFSEPLSPLLEHGIQRHDVAEPAIPYRLIVGVAPDGAMAAWLAGDSIVRRVIGGRGSHVDIDFSRIVNGGAVDRAAYRRALLLEASGPDVSERVLTGERQRDYWHRVMVRRSLRLAIAGIGHLYRLAVEFADGELHFYSDEMSLDIFEQRSMPMSFRVSYVSATGIAMRTHVSASAAAMMDIADHLANGERATKLSVVLDLTGGANRAIVSVRNETTSVVVPATSAGT